MYIFVTYTFLITNMDITVYFIGNDILIPGNDNLRYKDGLELLSYTGRRKSIDIILYSTATLSFSLHHMVYHKVKF